MLKRNIAVHIVTFFAALPVLEFIFPEAWYIFPSFPYSIPMHSYHPFMPNVYFIINKVLPYLSLVFVATIALSHNQVTKYLRRYIWVYIAYFSTCAISRIYSYLKMLFDSTVNREFLLDHQVIIPIISAIVLLAIAIWAYIVLRKHPRVEKTISTRYWHFVGPGLVLILVSYAVYLNHYSPLNDAITAGQYDEVKQLLADNPELINTRDIKYKAVPLSVAIGTNDTSMARLLIDAGAEITNNSVPGFCPLNKAVYMDNSDMIELLLENGAPIEECNMETPLTIATQYNKSHAFYTLLAHNANVHESISYENLYNPDRAIVKSPLKLAAKGGNVEFVRVLLEHGAAIGAIEPDSNQVIHDACLAYWAEPEDIITVLGLLLDAGADVNAKGNCNRTPLHLIAISDPYYDPAEDPSFLYPMDTSIVNYLLSKGGDKTAVDAFGKTPLDYARECGHNDIAAILERESL
ncbi:MAG: ankyrin repeat domain-containing protein [Candidatus Zixiibacteriota bacterium]